MKFPGENHFDKKLRKAAKAIKRESRGRKCGDCRHKAGCFCMYNWGIPEYELFIYVDDAVACKRWKHKPNGVRHA